MQRLATGIWGGQHISIEVGPRSATIEYDCANGTITGPFTTDSKGRFKWRGAYIREHHGPIRMNEEPNSRQAIYSGVLKGETMTLTVKFADTNEVVATYTLKRGNPGRVRKCL